MSGTLEDTANSEPRYIGHRDLTEDDIRYNAELDRIIQSQKHRRYKSCSEKRDLETERKTTLDIDTEE